MPTDHIVALLLQERQRIDNALAALQPSGTRHGRPAKLLDAPEWVTGPVKKKRGRSYTAAQKKEAAARMRRLWAERKAKGSGKKKAVTKS